MQFRSPRTLLTLSAVLALSASALAPTAAFAKGPGPGAGSGDCDADCVSDQTLSQQQTRARARDGSAQQTGTQANAGGGGQVQARAGGTRAQVAGGNGKAAKAQSRGGQAAGGQGAGPAWDEDTARGPQACEDCQSYEMGTLSDDDIAGLVYMANEEKLAHDVYTLFAEQYDLSVFANIANSEARHLVAVHTILEKYGIEDPTIGLGEGSFSDPDLQQLYAELIAQGTEDLEEALAAAILIEETDIADLEVRMEGLEVTAPDVHDMYSHLLTASGYHLAAFEGQL